MFFCSGQLWQDIHYVIIHNFRGKKPGAQKITTLLLMFGLDTCRTQSSLHEHPGLEAGMARFHKMTLSHEAAGQSLASAKFRSGQEFICNII